MDQLLNLSNRILFIAACVLAVLAVREKFANMSGMTMLRGVMEPGRLLEHAALALLFVIAIQLRQIKLGLNKTAS
jgi:ABC-type phosphate/phosphonate transport system permease subunit